MAEFKMPDTPAELNERIGQLNERTEVIVSAAKRRMEEMTPEQRETYENACTLCHGSFWTHHPIVPQENRRREHPHAPCFHFTPGEYAEWKAIMEESQFLEKVPLLKTLEGIRESHPKVAALLAELVGAGDAEVHVL